jgi:uncharacterized protein with PQ loop repeat
MNYVAQAFGWAGFALLQVFYMPQTIRMLKTKDVTGLSLMAWVILWLGLFCYVLYSIAQRDLIFILGNTAGLAQTSLQIGLILKYKNG